MQPISIKNKLAPTPTNEPKFQVKIKDSAGNDVVTGDPSAIRAMVALMNQHAVIGGAAAHWGGPSAFSEILSATHTLLFQKENWFDHFHFINDAGHCENAVYATRANYGFAGWDLNTLKGFRSIESKLTGHGEAHLNPESVFISNGPLGSGLPQAQGLALADRLKGNKRTTIITISDGASMEGEAKEAFASIPGFAQKGKLNPFVMIISDNDTKLSGRISDDSYSMNPTFESLTNLGWNVLKVEDGHHLENVYQQIEAAISEARSNPNKPIALWCKTIKGKGIKSTEEAPSGGHGYPLKAYDAKLASFISEIFEDNVPSEFSNWVKEIEASAPPKEAKSDSSGVIKEKVQVGFAKGAIKAAKEGLPVISISADLQGSTGIAPFHKEFPDQSIDIGVSESNMISTAIGLSKEGFIPIVDTFAQFGITKGNLPLIMSGLSKGPIIALFSHTGFQDAADGASHQSTTYFSATMAIPQTKIISCSCSSEAEFYMYEAITKFKKDIEAGKTPDSILFFLGRENHPRNHQENPKYEWLKPNILASGKDALVVTTGPLVDKALKAKEILAKEGINISVINHTFVNKPHLETFEKELLACGNKLVTVEDHQASGGMGTLLTSELSKKGHALKCRVLGIDGKYGQSAYKADHLYAEHGLDENAIVRSVKELN